MGVKKKVDNRIRALIENGVKTNHRSLFVLVGDHGKDQVVNLHYILSKARVATRPSVLWCYKKEVFMDLHLGFSTHRQKRMRQLKRQKKSGLASAGGDSEDPFELFINSTTVRWTYYKETHKVLGQTFGMCVLQDFEALTPNLLARTIETVEGGGIICLLLKTVSSLQQLYTLTMDVHDRFRTESHADVVGRFNERFMLSLADCTACLACDDELNVLPLSRHMKSIEALPASEDGAAEAEDMTKLADLKKSLEDTPPVGPLVAGAKTLDQAGALLTFMEAISEKTLRTTVVLTAARGRGKSATMGLCLAGAVSYGYSNIFVTAPSPENLGTLFEFILKGFDLLKYQEHLDYEVLQSANPAFNKAVVRINIFRDHRQTIQYIQPQDSAKLSHAELLAIDEAAAIPLPLVKALLGPYLVFMSSTVNGYEGTGRALSLKLVDQLRQLQGTSQLQAANAAASSVRGTGKGKGSDKVHEERWKRASEAAANASAHGGGAAHGRGLREVTLQTPIRYAAGDPIEGWLHSLLCLDSSIGAQRLVMGTPAPLDCELYYVDRDALFSYHKLSESFLQRVMSLYTAAHYKNQPNDLQLLSDAPAHHLFVLLGPKAEQQGSKGELPDVLCVLQVALEGKINRASVEAAMSRGQRASGDLIPWTLSQQFQDNSFPSLSGGRVVRIATHPDVQKMGYGARAMQLLTKYYDGELVGLDADSEDEADENTSDVESDKDSDASDSDDSDSSGDDADSDAEEEEKKAVSKEKKSKEGKGLAHERLVPRKKLPPLLVKASHRKPERLHWLGVSYGVTGPLLRFWRRCGMELVYLRQTTNDVTGEHTAIMLRALRCEGLDEAPAPGWLPSIAEDCRRRCLSLFAHAFRSFDSATALTLVDAGQLKLAAAAAATNGNAADEASCIGAPELGYLLTPHDLKRVELYAHNMVDYHLITDLLPTLARLYFMGRLPQVSTSYLQAAILLGLGLQNRTVDDMVEELQLPDNQVLALFNKAVRKLCNALRAVQEKSISAEMSKATGAKAKAVKDAERSMSMMPQTMDEDLEEAAEEATKKLKGKKEKRKDDLLKSLDLQEFAVKGNDEEWSASLSAGASKSVQIKSERRSIPVQLDEEADNENSHKRKSKGGDGKKKEKKKHKSS